MQNIVVRQLIYGFLVLVGALVIVAMLVNLLESRAYDAEVDNYHPPLVERQN